jgi:hypothetical protein
VLYIGLDLGQRQDHSAIAVVERNDLYRAYEAPALHSLILRHVERAPLGMPYPQVVARVKSVVRAGLAEGGCTLAVDATGVGAPVVDMLRGGGLGCEITAVSITGGDRARHSRGVWNVPKQDLMGGLQVLLERGELKIARGLGQAGALMKELVDVKARIGSGGRVRVGADGAGEHDDLVIALALACWRAGRKQVGFGTRRLPGI